MATYVFMPELVGLGARNLSGWLEDNQLLIVRGFDRVLNVEKALRLEHDLRHEMITPTLCFTIDEIMESGDWQRLIEIKFDKNLIQKILDVHYEEAKKADRLYEYISEPFSNNYCIRLIGIRYQSQFWKGYTQVTLQVVEKYKKKWKGVWRQKFHVKTLGTHVERVESDLLKLLENLVVEV